MRFQTSHYRDVHDKNVTLTHSLFWEFCCVYVFKHSILFFKVFSVLSFCFMFNLTIIITIKSLLNQNQSSLLFRRISSIFQDIQSTTQESITAIIWLQNPQNLSALPHNSRLKLQFSNTWKWIFPSKLSENIASASDEKIPLRG